MFNKQLKDNIKELDEQIYKLIKEMEAEPDSNKNEMIIQKIEDLTDVRNKLSDGKVKDSVKKEIISGLVGMTALVVVLRYEKAEIITSKAFGMIPKLFRGV